MFRAGTLILCSRPRSTGSCAVAGNLKVAFQHPRAICAYGGTRPAGNLPAPAAMMRSMLRGRGDRRAPALGMPLNSHVRAPAPPGERSRHMRWHRVQPVFALSYDAQ